MLTFHSHRFGSFCDGLSRRGFLKIGALGMAGLSLADLLRLKAEGAVRKGAPFKSVIMVYLPGGPSHIDMYDMKPDAPAEFRGEFKPIKTNVPGIEICEHMSLQAKIADKLAIVRGLKTLGYHDPYELLATDDGRLGSRTTGRNPRNPKPAFGSFVSRLRGDRGSSVPPYVGIKNLRLLPSYEDPDTAAYLGSAYQPFRPSGPGLADMSLVKDVTHAQLTERKTLLHTFDNLRRDLDDPKGTLAGVDSFTARALEIISSNKVRDAFDLSREPDKIRAAYGVGSSSDRMGGASDLLLARRLVEAGVSVVTLPFRFYAKIGDGYGQIANHWDTHAYNFKFLRLGLPQYDQAVSALVNDLYQRGLDKDVLVVIWGEFGRTPRIENKAFDPKLAPNHGGRHHHPDAGFVLLAGGGLKMGQVVGETDRRAERSKGRPFRPSHVLATIYHVLGIDPAMTFPDHSGRPQYVLDEREPIKELL